MRWRIATLTAALVLVIILAQALALLLVFDEDGEDFVEQVLDQQIAHSMTLWPNGPEQAAPNTRDMQLYHVPAAPPVAEPPAHFAQLGIGNHEVHAGDREYHVAVRDGPSGRFILAYDVEEHEERGRARALVIIFGALLMSGVTLLAVYLLAGQLTRRLESLVTSVSSGSGGHARPGMERELLLLARALDAHEARQAAQLARERDFSANLSHELRTPLTSIRGDAELIADLPELPPGARRRAERIGATVERITALAESLLALARDIPEAVPQRVPLAALIREVWEGLLPAQSGRPGPTLPGGLVSDIPATASITANPALLRLVLRNLLDNALRHTPEGAVRCVLEGTTVPRGGQRPGIFPGGAAPCL